jgi:hypothetical protein
MKKKFLLLTLFVVLTFSTAHSIFSQHTPELKIDPMLLILLKECRNISDNLADKLFPNWSLRNIPVLFYRPNVQDVLINFPHKPKGFKEYKNFNLLDGETFYYRNDTTLFNIDDQNTSTEIDSVPVLVVADPYSSMRNVLTDMLQRPKDFVSAWLKNWEFIPNPYDKIKAILHEAFHVYQNKLAPQKGANESIVAQYPLLDPENNALYVLEGNILKDALITEKFETRLEKIKEFVAVRSFRQSRLDSSWVEYENLNEYAEGLAKYIEYKFMKLGEAIEPIKEMQLLQGFNGYIETLSKQFQIALTNMVNIVAVNDNRFGNKFGAGPLRFKLYDLGACQAVLLDDVMPGWKEKIFQPKEFLSNLLIKSVALSNEELKQYLAKAKLEYNYDEAYNSKLAFEKEGKQKIEEKVNSILKTDKTLVQIFYGGITPKARVARYTPFGVTQVNKQSAIYEMVPIIILFKKGIMLDFKQSIPVLVDHEKQQIVFAVSTPSSQFGNGEKNKIDVAEFSFVNPMDIQCEGNAVKIVLK